MSIDNLFLVPRITPETNLRDIKFEHFTQTGKEHATLFCDTGHTTNIISVVSEYFHWQIIFLEFYKRFFDNQEVPSSHSVDHGQYDVSTINPVPITFRVDTIRHTIEFTYPTHQEEGRKLVEAFFDFLHDGPSFGMYTLDYADFILPGSISSADIIPIHPRVIKSGILHTQDFFDCLLGALPSKLEQANAKLQRANPRWPKIYTFSGQLLYEQIDYRKQIESGLDVERLVLKSSRGAANIGFQSIDGPTQAGRTLRTRIEPGMFDVVSMPLKGRMLEHYQLEDGSVVCWYEHNTQTAQIPLQLYFATYAIAANNLALRQLDPK